MRVLHLIDGGFRAGRRGHDPCAAAAACTLMLDRAGPLQTVCLLGPRSAADRLRAMGFRIDAAIAPPLGSPASAWLALRRFAAAGGRPDVVQCWGRSVARLALRAFGDSLPRAAFVQSPGWVDADVVLSASPECGPAVHVPPPVLPAGGPGREALRRSWGIPLDRPVVAQIGVAPQADALRFTFLVGILVHAGVGVTGLACEAAGQRPRGTRFRRGREHLPLVTCREPLHHALTACDAAVFDGGGPAPTADYPPSPWAATAIAQAHALGVPVVAPAWARGEWYPDAAEPCLAHNSTLPELSRVLLPLLEDSALRARASAAVAAHAARLDPATRFADGVQDAWERAIAGAPEPSCA
jgi:hypothetical protein